MTADEHEHDDRRRQHQRLVFPSLVSTGLVTLIRFAFILLPRTRIFQELVLPSAWLYSPALVSLFVKRHQTLGQVQEAEAIQRLFGSGGQSFKLVDAYQFNKTIRIPPLLLNLCTKFSLLNDGEFWFSIAMLAVDFAVAVLLEAIARHVLFAPSRQVDEEESIQKQLDEKIRPCSERIFPIERDGSKEKAESKSCQIEMSSLPLIAAQAYFWSPITALAGGSYYCFQNLIVVCTLWGIYEAMKPTGSYSWSAFFLAMAAYIEPHCLVFLVPACLWATGENSSFKSSLVIIGLFFMWTISFQYLSYVLVGPYKYIEVLDATYGWSHWQHLQPSLSVVWYFQMQMFDRFRIYYEFLITGLPYCLVAPLTIRLYRYPEVLVASFWLIWTIFRSSSTLYDLNMGLCLLLLSPRSLARVNAASLIAYFCLWGPVLLYVVDSWMWLETGSGNANYIFFQCLAYSAFVGIILCQFVSASVKRDKALRLTLKMQMTQTASLHTKSD